MGTAAHAAVNADLMQQLVLQLYALVAELEAAAPGRSFTPDGHLLGSAFGSWLLSCPETFHHQDDPQVVAHMVAVVHEPLMTWEE